MLGLLLHIVPGNDAGRSQDTGQALLALANILALDRHRADSSCRRQVGTAAGNDVAIAAPVTGVWMNIAGVKGNFLVLGDQAIGNGFDLCDFIGGDFMVRKEIKAGLALTNMAVDDIGE